MSKCVPEFRLGCRDDVNVGGRTPVLSSAAHFLTVHAAVDCIAQCTPPNLTIQHLQSKCTVEKNEYVHVSDLQT